jgi:hypothetical protein
MRVGSPDWVASELRRLASGLAARPSRAGTFAEVYRVWLAVELTALPKEWRLITDEQIAQIMERMPPGTEIYGSYATGKASQGSDLDLNLYIGALNISMPCEDHPNCTILAHTDEGHLLPPLIEHLTGGVKSLDDLTEDQKKVREFGKSNMRKFIQSLEDDSYYRLTPDDMRAIEKFLAGRNLDEIIEEYGREDLSLEDLVEQASQAA